MKKLILLSLLFFNSLFGAYESNVLDSEEIYGGSAFNITGTCKATCRGLAGDYKGIVVDFNPFLGVTKCNIIQEGWFEDTSSDFVADTRNQTCVDNTSQKVSESSLASYGKRFDNNVTFTYSKQDTLSKLFVGTLTLDDDIINIPATVGSNQLVLKGGGDILDNATFKSLSNANLGFFVNLIYGFQKVYAYVQYFLFIFIGAFFLIVYIWEMAVNKVGKTGEKEKMNKFVIPLVMVLLCFIPIPKENGITITPIQSTIQYFMQESNKLADRISVIGSESYIKKLYGMIGTNKISEEKELAERVLNLKAGLVAYKTTYDDCKSRFEEHYKDYRNFQSNNEELIKIAESQSVKGGVHYSFQGCKKIETDLINSERELIEKETALQGIKAAMGGEVASMLAQLKTDMEKKNNAYGWIYTAFLPSNAVVVENMSSLSNSVVQNNVKERNLDLDTKYNLQSSNEYVDNTEDGGFLGSLAYFMLPGAFGTYQAIVQTEQGIAKSLKLASKASKVFEKIPFIGGLAGAGSAALQTSMNIAAVALTTKIYSTILEYLPLAVGIVAGFIAIGTFLIELFKYFYVAPFMVAYSITKQRQNKIIDFFVDGIGLFLKPMLITISILIALVIYYLFAELFMGLTLLNFEFFGTLGNAFGMMNSLITATFTTMLHIIVSIATAFMMYQVIVNGAKAFLSLAGLQDKDTLSNSLAQRMDRQTFQV